MIAIVVSREDSASEHIAEHLLTEADWTEHRDDSRPDADGGGDYFRSIDGSGGFELRTFDDLHLYLDRPADAFDDPDLLVFASRHSGETGPLLTAHFTGNVGPAEYGGEAGELAEAAPNALAHLLDAFAEYAPPGYDVGMECTHHGPSAVGAPSLFAEVGSDEAQWDDPGGARAVARAILELRGVAPHRERQVVGLGGGHYAPRFSRVATETGWAVGHVAADWALEELPDAEGLPNEGGLSDEYECVLRQLFERSHATRALIDGDRPDLAAAVRGLGYEVVGERWLRETDDVPLALVAALEDALRPVEAGLRFGEPAREADGGAESANADGEAAASFSVVDLPAELVAAADGLDAAATRAAVAARALAFETEDAGNRVTGRVALPAATTRDAIVAALADVLRGRYDEVTVEPDAVVARETAFDPAAARERGVPEGPKFGALADGNAVDVDGETVHPEDVTTEREERFPLDG